jgi:hypothetical protein
MSIHQTSIDRAQPFPTGQEPLGQSENAMTMESNKSPYLAGVINDLVDLTAAAAQAVLWGEVLDRYLVAERTLQEANNAADAAWEAVDAVVPTPPEIQDEDGYLTPSDVDKLVGVPVAIRAQMKAIAITHGEARNRAMTELGYDAASEAADAAGDALTEARAQLFATTAPDTEAHFRKLAILWRNEKLDDDAVVADVLTRKHDAGLLSKIYIYRDAARLAGVKLSTADIAPWDVEAFGAAFLAAHRGSWNTVGSPYWIENDSGELDRGPSGPMWDALTDWQRKAAQAWLSCRPRQGDVARLEAEVRGHFRPYADPRKDALCYGRRSHSYTQADIDTVMDRIDDLVAEHAAYLSGAGGWVDRYLNAGGDFSLVPAEGGMAVLIGRTPENTAAAAVDAELTPAMRPAVIDEIKSRMALRKTSFLSRPQLAAAE